MDSFTRKLWPKHAIGLPENEEVLMRQALGYAAEDADPLPTHNQAAGSA